MENFEPRRGAFAFNSLRELGLITSETSTFTKKCLMHEQPGAEENSPHCPYCQQYLAWVGIHLSPEKFGQPWSSISPRVVGEIRQEVDSKTREQFFVVEGRRYGRALLEL